MEEGVVRSRFGHFRSFLEVCVVVFVTHVVPFFMSHFLIRYSFKWSVPRIKFVFVDTNTYFVFVSVIQFVCGPKIISICSHQSSA